MYKYVGKYLGLINMMLCLSALNLNAMDAEFFLVPNVTLVNAV